MKWQSYYNPNTHELKIGKIIVTIFIIVLLVMGTIWMIKAVLFPVGVATDIVKKTFDADNIIHNYEWFKQMAEDLDAAEKRVNITTEALAQFKEDLKEVSRKDWGFEDKDQYATFNTDLRGQKAHLEQMKADFRARSKMANRAIFKGNSKIIRWVDELAGVESD